MSCLNCRVEVVILAMRGDSSGGSALMQLKLLIHRPIYYQLGVAMFFKQLAPLLFLLLLTAVSADCPRDAEEFLVTFHPHLDAFWLDTDDDLKNINFRPQGFLYAMNQRNSKTIFNSMLEALNRNATRKYFVSEAVFFKDWYDYLPADKKDQVKKLFEKGQLDIANGGWVENDEAVCYLDDIIDQYTVGHNFLNSEFGLTTKIGWATDSFGHSHSQVAIQHLLGFEFQGIERIDDRYIYERNGGSLLEFYWSAVSDSNGRKYGGVMTLIRHFLHEVNDLRHANIDGIVGDFTKLQANMEKLYHKNKLFRFLGNDFEEFVDEEFTNLEAAFKKLNKDEQCPTYKYGNPIDYLDVIKDYYAGDTTPVREHDFMPNYDQDHYWSGYYTSNPDLKKICKDFSRLVNLFRKVYAKSMNAGHAENGLMKNLLRQADELLAVMQHHDGITATSKYHIEEQFKDRMKTKSVAIISALSDLKEVPHQYCSFYQGGNSCVLNSQDDTVYLSIIHEGAPKKERLEIILPKTASYEVSGDDNDEIFCNPKSEQCSLVFEPKLLSGENVFILNKIEASKGLKTVKGEGGNYKDDDFSISVNGTQFTYKPNNDQFIKVSYVQSANRLGGASTYTWDKYGNKINKYENRMAGIYIMANNGQLSDLKINLDVLSVAKGKIFTKIYLGNQENNAIVTIKNSQKNVIDLQTSFKPPSRDQNDYFIKVESPINSKGEFYHDSNGYLVIKRKVGERPDYQWEYRPEDKINANNYPMCSFAYAIDGDQKLVIFTDRAQGFTQYDNAYLINIDRLAGDDYKGVGEGYNYLFDNVFQHKIGLVSKSSNIEREWQRNFDEALIGFYSSGKRESNSKGQLSESSKYLKYSIFILNSDEYVLRIFNLAENQNLELPKYSSTAWNIQELNLELKFADIRESFANGLPLSERRSWNKLEGEINMFNGGSKDTPEKLVLAPLQVRSFRINNKGSIAGGKASHNDMLELTLTEVTPVTKVFAKRCF